MAEAKPLTITEFARMGGKALAKKMSKKERQESARRAAAARWAKEREESKTLKDGANELLSRAKARSERTKAKKGNS